MKTWDTIRRWATLAGLVGLAAGTLAIQACTRESPGVEEDGAVDAAITEDAGLDGGVADAEQPDAQFLDVICE